MDIAIVGNTGYIGGHVSRFLQQMGYRVIGVNRKLLQDDKRLAAILREVDAVCCFTGYPVIKRWTKRNKRKMYDSRGGVLQRIYGLMQQENIRLKTVVSASAIGIYDNVSFNHEESNYLPKGFLSELIEKWEPEALREIAERVIYLRIGVVLGAKSGYLQKLMIPWMFRISPAFNKGNSNFTFIHIEDLVRVVQFSLEHENIDGVVNAIAPEVNKEYNFHDQLKGIFMLFVPGIVAKIIFGKAAQLLLNVPKVIPEKLVKSGFLFRYPTLQDVLHKI